MCPVMTASGEVVGFSGRLLGEADERSGAKYINSPESALFKKSRLLFGLHQARDGLRKAGYALVVEGNFDVISLHQAGFTQALAPLGTSFTDEQAQTLRRLSGDVVLLYDGDNAGRKATLKTMKTLLAAGLSVRIALLPAGDDPDSLLTKGGKDSMCQILDHTQPALEYFIHEVWSRSDHSAHSRANALQEAAQVLKTISDPTKRDFAVGTLAAALGTSEPTLRKGLRRALDRAPHREAAQAAESPENAANIMSPPPALELDILTLLSEYPQLLKTADELGVFSSLTGPAASRHVLRRARGEAHVVGDLRSHHRPAPDCRCPQ